MVMRIDKEKRKNIIKIIGMRRVVGVGNIKEMKDKVGIKKLLESWKERGKEMVRKIGNKEKSVRKDESLEMGKKDEEKGRIESGEKNILRKKMRKSNEVEKNGF